MSTRPNPIDALNVAVFAALVLVLAAPPITAWKIDRERYRAVPFYSDGKPGPAIELRDFFEQFLNEVGQSGQ
jgi:hypothetical protein